MRELTFAADLCNDILGGGQTFFVTATGPDETYCQEDIRRAVLELGKYTLGGHDPLATVTWDLINGFNELKPDNQSRLRKPLRDDLTKKTDPIEAVKSLLQGRDGPWAMESAVIIMRDMQEFFNIPAIARMFRNGRNQCLFNVGTKVYRRPVVILANSASKLTDAMRETFRLLPYPLPKEPELFDVVNKIEASTQAQIGTIKDEELKIGITQALLGLTKSNAENILSYAIRVVKKWDNEIIEVVEDRKAQELQKSEILGYTPRFRLSGKEDVGGCDLLKGWLHTWKRCFTKKARELKLPPPKGMILGGPPGTGKSLLGTVTAAELNLPLFELRYARAYGSLVGQTEERLDRALQVIDSMGPSVVFIDEAEKLLAGSKPGGSTSNDVSTRAFGIFNTWLTKPNRQAFVICTMNRTEGVPDEFLRKGRFNKIFLVGRPAGTERIEIAKIHLRKQTPDGATAPLCSKLKAAQWKEFADATKDYTGAEIEEVITTARYRAFMNREEAEPRFDELMEAVREVSAQAKSAQAAAVEDMITKLADADPVSSVSDDESESGIAGIQV